MRQPLVRDRASGLVGVHCRGEDRSRGKVAGPRILQVIVKAMGVHVVAGLMTLHCASSFATGERLRDAIDLAIQRRANGRNEGEQHDHRDQAGKPSLRQALPLGAWRTAAPIRLVAQNCGN